MINKAQAMENVRKANEKVEAEITKAAVYHIENTLAIAIAIESEKGALFAKRQVSTCDERVLDKMVEILKEEYQFDSEYTGNWFIVYWAE